MDEGGRFLSCLACLLLLLEKGDRLLHFLLGVLRFFPSSLGLLLSSLELRLRLGHAAPGAAKQHQTQVSDSWYISHRKTSWSSCHTWGDADVLIKVLHLDLELTQLVLHLHQVRNEELYLLSSFLHMTK